MVEKALVELRKVVNAILRQYGKPDIIRLEMARDLKNSKKVREEIQKHNHARAKAREKAKAILQDEFSLFRGSEPTGDDIEKYLLWEDRVLQMGW